MKQIYTIFILIALSLFTAITGCGGKKGQLVIGDIQGPATVDEGSKTEFSITATGDDGIKFEWACDPSTSGYFTNRSSKATIFNAALVDKDKPVEISVMVSSVNHSPEVKILSITVKEISLAGLQVGDIIGPRSIIETVTVPYSITATGDTGITYEWSCEPESAGTLTEETESTAQFTAALTETDISAVIKVVVASDNHAPETRTVDIEITNSGVTGLFVGEIQGAAIINESSSVQYTVTAYGDSGIKYKWKADPSYTGTFIYDTKSMATFFTSQVTKDLTFTMSVEVTSDNYGPEERSIEVTIKDVNALIVDEIQGPVSVDDNTSVVYSITASGDTGITYLWECDPASAGTFDTPDQASTSFHAAAVTEDSSATIKVTVDCDNYTSVVKVLDIVIQYIPSGWTRVWGGPLGDLSQNQYEQSNGITIDASDNIYTIGEFYGTVDFDPSQGIDEHMSSWDSDVFLSKIDSLGNYKWSLTWGAHYGTGWDGGRDVCTDYLGNVFVTGFFKDTVDFDPGPAVKEQTSSTDFNCYLSKFDPSGNFQWVRTLGSPGMAKGYGITTDNLGNILVTGVFSGTVDFDPGASEALASTSSPANIFLVKFNSYGDFQWVRTWGGILADLSTRVAADPWGGIFVTGAFYGTVDFDPGSESDAQTATGGYDIFLSKFDSYGNYYWAKKWGGSGDDKGSDLAVDDSGYVYVTGIFQYGFDFDPGSGSDEHTAVDGSDVFVSKFDSFGKFIWTSTWGGNSNDFTQGIGLSDDGYVYATGTFADTVDFDPGSGTDEIAGGGGFLCKYDKYGQYELTRTWKIKPFDVACDSLDYPYITGNWEGTVDFNPSDEVEEYTSHGGYDIFLLKLVPDGTY